MIGHPKRLVELELVAHFVGHVDDVSVRVKERKKREREREKCWQDGFLTISRHTRRCGKSKKERERRYVILRYCRTCRLVVICEPRKRPDGEGRIWDG